jgi:hypothetical protein
MLLEIIAPCVLSVLSVGITPRIAGNQTPRIESWTLWVRDELPEKDKAATKRATAPLTVKASGDLTRNSRSRRQRDPDSKSSNEGGIRLFSSQLGRFSQSAMSLRLPNGRRERAVFQPLRII